MVIEFRDRFLNKFVCLKSGKHLIVFAEHQPVIHDEPRPSILLYDSDLSGGIINQNQTVGDINQPPPATPPPPPATLEPPFVAQGGIPEQPIDVNCLKSLCG